jgi:S-adenosylmethionine:tRNA ribosyltransferase-isomerase
MDLTPFQFDLPERLIALRPADPQDAARLLIVHRDGRLINAGVRDLPQFLQAGDVLVFNDTRVLPAALKGIRPARGPGSQDVACDVNLVRRIDARTWRALARPARRLHPGDRIVFAPGLSAEVTGRYEAGEIEMAFDPGGDALGRALEAYGAMPLPPYIARRRPADAQDRQTYQSRLAAGEALSVAAPTAALHFTPRVLEALDAAGFARETVRLQIGMGTFKPLEDHHFQTNRLHTEWRSLSAETANRLNAARRVVPVGTTALRTLESAADLHGRLHAVEGGTDIFLKPGDTFRATGALVTNFHLPESSLFMLVCALMGTDVMQAAYVYAIAHEYRFYSYGDACLLLP